MPCHALAFMHGGHNNATVATVASVGTHVPQLNTAFENLMRTILIKIIVKSIEVNAWYTTR